MQPDIKRILAYSTISQLGYMFLALGVHAYGAAIFLVVTHAFYKATLFLGAGSVIHGLGDNQDIRTMGGLRRYLPITTLAFGAAWLAIAGIPGLAGFWSKDEVLAKAFFADQYALWAVGVVAALLTGLYMTREMWLVFFGNERFRAPTAGSTATGEAGGEAPVGRGLQEAGQLEPSGNGVGRGHRAQAEQPRHARERRQAAVLGEIVLQAAEVVRIV
jgi:NADH-quinone oxidoreductase subunit L